MTAQTIRCGPQTLQIEDPVLITTEGETVYGHVIALKGGIVCVRTPNGTEVESGSAWVHKLKTERS